MKKTIYNDEQAIMEYMKNYKWSERESDTCTILTMNTQQVVHACICAHNAQDALASLQSEITNDVDKNSLERIVAAAKATVDETQAYQVRHSQCLVCKVPNSNNYAIVLHLPKYPL